MARRRQKHLIDSKAVLGLLAVVSAIWLIAQILKQLSYGSGEGLGLIVLAVLAYLVIRHRQRVNARRILFQKVQSKIEQQIGALVRRRAQLVWQDAYGKPQMDRWVKEINYFITQQIEPLLTANERRMLEREGIEAEIETRVKAAIQSQPVFREFSDDMTPAEFENFCAEELRRFGWVARVTKQSRDQGVDVVAERGDVRVVIQCKLYSRPVGNKSVQEAAAAKAHEQARYGIVVTNASYTSAAEQLASTNGILLLHYSDLQNLHSLLDA